MAKAVIILRPSTLYYDINNGTGSPGDENSSQVTAVNEVVADDDANYISATAAEGSSTGSHIVHYGVSTPNVIPKEITGGKLHVRYTAPATDTLYTNVCFSLGNSSIDTTYEDNYNYPAASEWTTHSRDIPSTFIAKINESLINGVFPENMCIYVSMSVGTKVSPKVTQIYLELYYETEELKSFELRPSADISVEHSLSSNVNFGGYVTGGASSVWESVRNRDDGKSLVYNANSSDISDRIGKAVSTVALSGDVVLRPIDSIVMYATHTQYYETNLSTATPESTVIYTLSLDEYEYSITYSETKEDSTPVQVFTYVTNSNLIDAINQYILTNNNFPSLQLTIDTRGSHQNDTYVHAGAITSVDEVYLIINYQPITDIGVYKNINGEWESATQAFKKVSGSWTEIDADECKQYLTNSFVIK